jgi:hypothetical protein
MLATVDGTTGVYAGKDYFGEVVFQPGVDPDTMSLSGSLRTLTLSAPPSSDGDGVADGIEDAAPNGGDGNSDGTPDSQQADVASFPDATVGSYVTLVSPVGTNLTDVLARSEGSLPSAGKPVLQFPYGFFEFEITTPTAGDSVTLTIILPSSIPDDAQYWKYGPTPGDPTYHWYQIPWTRISSNVIAITLTDGGWGDDDLIANGTIIDQGGPGWPWPPGPTGGTTSAPVFPNLYVGVGAALGAGILAYFMRKRLAHS